MDLSTDAGEAQIPTFLSDHIQQCDEQAETPTIDVGQMQEIKYEAILILSHTLVDPVPEQICIGLTVKCASELDNNDVVFDMFPDLHYP